MKVNIKRIDKDLPLPIYETNGSVGFDLICREDTIICTAHLGMIPVNIIVKTPKGYMLSISLRSSTPRKKCLLIPHGIGVIDQDYCGPNDELKVLVYNFSKINQTVRRGDKIAQGIFIKVGIAKWNEIDIIEDDSRGGFGSTDN
tara:strand:- start:2128 stop:2559 length:432 start_codon:yes stop_codon:yes gene_type:complete